MIPELIGIHRTIYNPSTLDVDTSLGFVLLKF